MEKYEEIINTLNIPLIQETPLFTRHKIFIKYTSQPYYKYAFDLLKTLCYKTKYENKRRLLHISFIYLTLILYKCENIPYLSNFDLLIFCCFILAVKAMVKQNIIPGLSKMKKIYEKYINYKNEEIIKAEIICTKLLEYKINFLTIYDCLYYLLYNNKKILDLAVEKFENEILFNIKEYMNKNPMDFAKEIINSFNKKIKNKYPSIIIKKKIVPLNNHVNINKNKYFVNSTRILMENSPNNDEKQKNDKIMDYNKYSSIVTNGNNNQFRLFVPKTEKHYSIYKKNKKENKNKSKALNSSILVNSFTNLDIELNNSPFNKTNCSSSPCGSDGLSSFVYQNNSGIKIMDNSPNEIFKKPCLLKQNMKTSFILNKKSIRYVNAKNDLHIIQKKIIEESPLEKSKNNYLSNTFYSKRNKFDNKIKFIKFHS